MAKTKYTYEQVKQEFDLRGYDLISTEYKGVTHKLQYICRKHRDKGILTIDFKHFHDRGQGCKYCALEKPRSSRTSDSELMQICDKFGFTFVQSKAGRHHTLVYFICNKHKDKGVQTTTVSELKKKRNGCKYCTGMVKKTHDEFVFELNQSNPNIRVLTQYMTANTPVECECLICGHIWKATPNNLLSAKTGCKNCGYKQSGKKKQKSNSKFLSELLSVHPHITPLTNYNGATTKIEFKCKKCGHIFHTTPDRILHCKYGCPNCAKKSVAKLQTKTHDEFLRELLKINPDLEPLEKYQTDRTKIMVRCKIHDYAWYASPNKLLHRRTGCPKCTSSSNENKLCEILKKWGFQYMLQQRFYECKDKNPLPFDIYLNEENVLIEYDGEAHFIPIKRTSNESKAVSLKRLQLIRYHDEIKNKYCEENNIPLIRIPYWEQDNLEYFLWKEFVQYGLIEEIASVI